MLIFQQQLQTIIIFLIQAVPNIRNSQLRIERYVMAEVLIFRICQKADVARAAELSRSIRGHWAYPPFRCIAIV